MDQLNLTAAEILAIDSPYDLFRSNNAKEWTHIVRSLQSKWHPDSNGDPSANQVMAHINLLFSRIERGDLGKVFAFKELHGSREFFFKFKKEIPIDVGQMYIGKKMVAFCLQNDCADLYERAVEAIAGIRFPSKMLEAGFNRLVPKDLKRYGKTDKGYVFTVYKGPEQISLKDLLDAGHVLSPEHLTWTLNRLYHFALLMHQVQNKMLGGIDETSMFVNPQFKTVHVLGGWWCATPLNTKIIALPNSILPFVPSRVVNDGKSTTVVDQIAIKTLGIKALGDRTGVGSKLLMLEKKYHPIVAFLRSPVKATTLQDYSEWMKVTQDLSRGDLKVTFEDVYK